MPISETTNSVSITRRSRILRTVSIGILVLFGFIVAIYKGGQLGGGDFVFAEIGTFISYILAGTLIIYLASLLIKPLRKWIFPVGLALAVIILMFYSAEEDTAKRNSASSTAASTLQGNPRFLEIGTRHVERATEEVISRYPALHNPILDTTLPPSPSLNDLRKRRDAYKDVLSAAQTVQANFQDLFRSALLKDDPRFGTDLKALGVAQSGLPTVISSFDDGAARSGAAKLINLYAALSQKLEASALAVGFLIESYGKWQVNNGRFVFDTQQNVDAFNKLIAAENAAKTKFLALSK